MTFASVYAASNVANPILPASIVPSVADPQILTKIEVENIRLEQPKLRTGSVVNLDETSINIGSDSKTPAVIVDSSITDSSDTHELVPIRSSDDFSIGFIELMAERLNASKDSLKKCSTAMTKADTTSLAPALEDLMSLDVLRMLHAAQVISDFMKSQQEAAVVCQAIDMDDPNRQALMDILQNLSTDPMYSVKKVSQNIIHHLHALLLDSVQYSMAYVKDDQFEQGKLTADAMHRVLFNVGYDKKVDFAWKNDSKLLPNVAQLLPLTDTKNSSIDISNLLLGVSEGIMKSFYGLGQCYDHVVALENELVSAIYLLMSVDPSDKRRGFELLVDVGRKATERLSDCNPMNPHGNPAADYNKVINFIYIASDPVKFMEYIKHYASRNLHNLIQEYNELVKWYNVDSYEFGRAIGNMMGHVIQFDDHVSNSIAKSTASLPAPIETPPSIYLDPGLVMIGMYKGMFSDFAQIKACIDLSFNIVHEIHAAIEEFKSYEGNRVRKGIKLFADKLKEVIIPACGRCSQANEELREIQHALDSLSDPISFIYVVGKNAIVNGKEINSYLNQAISAYSTDLSEILGYNFGLIVNRILIGMKESKSTNLSDVSTAEGDHEFVILAPPIEKHTNEQLIAVRM